MPVLDWHSPTSSLKVPVWFSFLADDVKVAGNSMSLTHCSNFRKEMNKVNKSDRAFNRKASFKTNSVF